MKYCLYLFLFIQSILIPSAYALPSDACHAGKFIQLNGYKIYYQIHGHGVPIVFDSGLGDDLTVWNKIIPVVDKFAKTITYDRIGIGCSQKTNSNIVITSQDSVNILHTVLVKEQVAPPYILVGQSLGGLNMQLFAAEYPAEVKGVVLIESMSRDQTIYDAPPNKSASYYPEAMGIKASILEVNKAKPFPAVSLIVITATVHPGLEKFEPLWQKWQKQIVLLSPLGVQVIAKGSGHDVQEDQPSVVIESIKKLITY